MLTFEEKITIIESYPELKRHDVSLNRVNYHYEESVSDKKVVIYHLHPNGNGFVYAGKLKIPQKDTKGMVNIRNFSEQELRSIIERSIESLQQTNEIEQIEAFDKIWLNKEGHSLVVIVEDEMWNVYAGELLDGTFPSYNEAKQYLLEEGFKPKRTYDKKN